VNQPTTVATAPSFETAAYAATRATSGLARTTIHRREPRASDLDLEVLFCGICHSDLHQARDEWHKNMPTTYPCVPGHEIVGRVVKAGSAVRRFREGALAAVGCMVDSCRGCAPCRAGEEQFCEGPAMFTYNGPDPFLGGVTYGGYSKRLVVDEAFALRVSDRLSLAGTAPLLCAGITTYSPLRRAGVGKASTVGVVGLGGLGHMAVKIAAAMGARVVVFTTSPKKAADAVRLGAQDVVLSTHPAEMQKQAKRFDFILDTVSAPHDLDGYLPLLKHDGLLTMVGAPEEALPIEVMNLVLARRRLSGSLIGGIRETQEMLDFCVEHGLTADVEVIPIQQVNEAYERLARNDVQYRFVIDMASLA